MEILIVDWLRQLWKVLDIPELRRILLPNLTPPFRVFKWRQKGFERWLSIAKLDKINREGHRHFLYTSEE